MFNDLKTVTSQKVFLIIENGLELTLKFTEKNTLDVKNQ